MRRVVCGTLLLVLAAALRPPVVAAADGLRILYPPPRSVHSGPVRLIVAAPKDAPAPTSTLDGQTLSLQRLAFAESWQLPGKLKVTAQLVDDRAATALWVAVLDLKPGAHVVLVGTKRLELWRAEGDPPADTARCYAHQPVGDTAPAGGAALDCGGCHEQPDGKLGSVPTPKACAGCHDESAVQLKHHHVSEPLARCAMCHDPHGTVRPRMLVDSKAALCSKCHEAGHSKE